MEDDRGLRGDASDPERANPVAGQRRHRRAAPIHTRALRHRCVITGIIQACHRLPLASTICNRSPDWTSPVPDVSGTDLPVPPKLVANTARLIPWRLLGPPVPATRRLNGAVRWLSFRSGGIRT